MAVEVAGRLLSELSLADCRASSDSRVGGDVAVARVNKHNAIDDADHHGAHRFFAMSGTVATVPAQNTSDKPWA
jgi:hypothetical protein